MGNKKLQVWLPLLFAIVMILGMFFGYRLNTSGNARGFLKQSNSTSLQEAVDLIKQRYVDKVNTDSMESGAIQLMLGELDPHSVYFPPVELKAVNEDLAGNFDGIGVEFNVFSDTVNITFVIPGGPSDQAGLQIGDKIITVNGAPLTGDTITNTRIRELIRGERGSVASIKVLRVSGQKVVEVKRGSIPVAVVDAAFMIDKTTGYIKLNKFGEQSYEEFMKAMEDLQKQGMTALIFDLRGNGGGYMNEAIDMADEFLSGDKLIVYTEGVHSKKQEYRCKRPGLFETGKLVMLIDESSASATEVLAGALQDWDRATIIGRRSFGKGLVQEQYELSDGSAVRLTVARYYSPLGRSIQRPYNKGKKEYMDEIWQRYSNGEVLVADSNKVQKGKAFQTPGGRTVYGGGGIMPDVFVPIDTASYPASIAQLFSNGQVSSFIYQYYLRNRPVIDKFSTATDYVEHFNLSENMWQQFAQEFSSDSVRINLSAAQKETLQRRMEGLLARFRWRNNGYFQVLNADDNVIQKAEDELKK